LCFVWIGRDGNGMEGKEGKKIGEVNCLDRGKKESGLKV